MPQNAAGRMTDAPDCVPSDVPGIDVEQFSVPDRVEDFDAAQVGLREEQLTHPDQFDDLDDDIRDATY